MESDRICPVPGCFYRGPKLQAHHDRRHIPQELPPNLVEAISAFETAAFDCGEWNRDESDETWDDVHSRMVRARERLSLVIRRAMR